MLLQILDILAVRAVIDGFVADDCAWTALAAASRPLARSLSQLRDQVAEAWAILDWFETERAWGGPVDIENIGSSDFWQRNVSSSSSSNSS